MPVRADAETMETARALKRALARSLFGDPVSKNGSYLATIPPGSNIQGFGYGPKFSGSAVVAEAAILVYVRQKISSRRVSESERIPLDFDGVPTDVVPIGEMRPIYPRPVKGGAAGAHTGVYTGGTLGCLVERNGAGMYILSNNHVLAASNAGSLKDPILEPGRDGGGAVHPPIAYLSDFRALDFSGGVNYIDAAVAELNGANQMLPEIFDIGRVVNPPAVAATTMSVRKYGRNGLTVGVVSDIAADCHVPYGSGRKAYFEDQIAVQGVNGDFGYDGDSGSLAVETTTNRAVGLVFASCLLTTLCNPIAVVLKQFNATIL